MNEMKELLENVGMYAKSAILPTVLLLVIGIMAMVMYELFSWVEKNTTGWAHRGSQG